MYDVLNDLGRNIQQFLEAVLPSCDAQWWDNCVLAHLTFQQRRVVDEKGLTSLTELDLAGLLRVLDQNWYDVNASRRLPFEARNWLKEAQSIRNRWAHLPPGGLNPDDRYRDLDTVWRLMTALGADDSSIARVRTARDEALSTVNRSHEVTPAPPPHRAATAIAKGDVVRLKARPDHTGAVIDILEGGGETRYLVFHDGTVSTYYTSQVELATPTPTHLSVDPSALHAALTALQLRHPSTSHLYSLFASRIQFVPYQFRPVLKLIQGDRPRMLVADEVGVGKTIEAGLILKELQARRDIRSILVICPKPLVAERKWMEEMKRFDEQFVHLDGDALRYCIEETHLDGVWPQQYARAILPYSLFDEALLMGKQKGRRRQRGLLDLDPPPTFDLVIVDEAHHIRNTDTWAYRTVRHFCDNAEAVVLLSATPIQLGDNDLFNLLHLLRPDVLPSRQDFDRMAEPNPHLNAAIEAARAARPDWKDGVRIAVEQAVATPWGKGVLAADPRVQRAYDLLAADESDAQARLNLVRQLEELYTFSPLINRTRRRDIGSFTTRKPDTVAVEFTPEQAGLHSDLIDLIARILAHRHGDENLKFMLTTVRRQVASCVFGLAPLLEAILHRHLSRIELSEVGDEDAPDEIGEILADFRVEVDALIRKARALTGPDPKFDAFLKVIRDKQKLPNNKLLVFSTFRHTLAYLVERLADEPVRIGLIHGDIPDEERRDLRNRFSLPKEAPQALDVLLSSEVGCEGLDYQFCDGLVNYDLPWNPMRVEQRIGRIDRYGQKSETVVIYNFITPGTVDAEIYERCLLRIGVFRQALGGSEEILGRLTREIRDIAENLALTPEEQAVRLQQLADNEVRAIQEQARLEEEQAKLFGLNLPRRDEDMVEQASSFWLAPPMLANLVERYLERLEATKAQRSLGRKAVTTLQLGQEARNKLLADFQALGLTGTVAQAWERWLKGSDPYLTLTFDPSTADERRDIVFITPTHPLARQAAQTIEPAVPLICDLSVETSDVPPGRYPYAIYRWRKHGLKEDFTFQPVCAGPEIAPHMLQLLESAHHHVTTSPITADEERDLEQAHYHLWSSARAEHIEEVAEVARSRITSLEITHAARLALLEEQRDTATDARIRRMRESQIETAKRDYERRADELTRAAQQGDIIAEAVAFGVLVTEGGNDQGS
ncbi:TPA: DEAD/DEAH box helicase family protein [Pseudomonas aeruginosa]|uniref:DEAD/DEAH box helicase n=1 Tax=Pseudomonas aeruginosa TaxID=287 RepID=UPI00053E3BC3|nr:SNF2-related protein [Pseudomonas aeruginosa]MBI7027888.1 DEAD/DEAH box helicase family protein [Pseudomonas aeruginosa]MBI9170421.1 DEAD/DEAH box helicase family protein [Pseudomonas aeruginosa]MBV5629000.1 DEAD/DEAH box helicase family protein [Pseudomonas aeruginosa]MBV5666125.1 DEAD/DEAH box helicase family protein [Pseudomonas aeruginosa]MCO4035471.1 helicase [Pseudomonas aeruginosa]